MTVTQVIVIIIVIAGAAVDDYRQRPPRRFIIIAAMEVAAIAESFAAPVAVALPVPLSMATVPLDNLNDAGVAHIRIARE
jgi:hypothetical protein